MNTLNFIKRNTPVDATAEQQLRTIVPLLLEQGIRCNYDPPQNAVDGGLTRLLLYSNRYNNKNYKLASECNGLIIDYSNWTVVCYPPETPNANYNATEVDRDFSKYRVFAAGDGTVLNLYYYCDQWRFSTTRGIDMGETEWCGITFSKAFNEQDVNITTLDTAKCYTFGMTHPSMHYTKQKKLWFIGSWSAEHGRSWDPEAGLQHLAQREFTGFCTVGYAISSTAGEFGIILRSTCPDTTRENSTVHIEHSKMKEIRQLIYDRQLTIAAEEFQIKRKEYISLLNLLDKNRIVRWLALYPDHAAAYQAAQNQIYNIASDVAGGNLTKDISRYFYNQIFTIRNVKRMSVAGIYDFITQKEYILTWHKFWVEQEPSGSFALPLDF